MAKKIVTPTKTKSKQAVGKQATLANVEDKAGTIVLKGVITQQVINTRKGTPVVEYHDKSILRFFTATSVKDFMTDYKIPKAVVYYAKDYEQAGKFTAKIAKEYNDSFRKK